VVSRRCRGMEVAAETPAARRARRQELLREHFRLALREAAASVLAPAEIRRLVDEELAAFNGHRPTGKR
jgi:hypothetical protein